MIGFHRNILGQKRIIVQSRTGPRNHRSHPLGYLVASAYPIPRLWFPFFIGWLTKTLVMKYGGSDTYVSLRPFMIGLILGNAVAMIFWTLLVFYLKGTPVGYWPA